MIPKPWWTAISEGLIAAPNSFLIVVGGKTLDAPFSDLVLFPHCDVHLVLDPAVPPLALRVFRRDEHPDKPGRYRLTRVEGIYEFFAPFKEPGDRFRGVPTVDPVTGVVTATEPGVFLFQVVVGTDYLVGRIQVHRAIENWWFGNTSITTALDSEIAHAQPSIYARFSADPGDEADLVGDITGHGYVTLVSRNPDRVEIGPEGRLRGLRETLPGDDGGTSALAVVTGTLLNMPPRALPVWVVDYGKVRADLHEYIRNKVANPEEMQNILLLPEGFVREDEVWFTAIGQDVAHQLFDKPRHEPYGLLSKQFNMFTRFMPWLERGITTGFQVTDRASGYMQAGSPIPYVGSPTRDERRYLVSQLVEVVGLPRRVENRADLPGFWRRQGLPIDDARIDLPLLEAWRDHKSAGLLAARDTLFGLILGARLGDRTSGRVEPPAQQIFRPADDVQSDALSRFIARVYEFYDVTEPLIIGLDVRRHPPEIHAHDRARADPLNSLLRFAGGLRFTDGKGVVHDFGKTWAVDDTEFRRSRGLIGMAVYDDLEGGTNFNASTVTAQTVNKKYALKAVYGGADPLEKRRDLRKVDLDLTRFTDVVAHEFGHSFNLADEYEGPAADPAEKPPLLDLPADNVSWLGFLRAEASPSRKLDIAKVKWLDLPCVLTSSRLLKDSTGAGAEIRVEVGVRETAKWEAARRKGRRVDLQNFAQTSDGRQLPLPGTPDQRQTGLAIVRVLPAEGAMILAGGQPFPIFKAGSTVFVPLLDRQGQRVVVTRKSVLKYLEEEPGPLNLKLDRANVSWDPDVPRPIPGRPRFRRPSQVVGIFEGAAHFTSGLYRPTGTCKMRTSGGKNENGQFCFVCKWLIVNRVNPGLHDVLTRLFYPEGNHE